MHFRPSHGLGPNPSAAERAAQEARAEAVGEKEKPEEMVYDQNRHEREFCVRKTLPPAPRRNPCSASGETPVETSKKDFRVPHLETPPRSRSFNPSILPHAPGHCRNHQGAAKK